MLPLGHGGTIQITAGGFLIEKHHCTNNLAARPRRLRHDAASADTINFHLVVVAAVMRGVPEKLAPAVSVPQRNNHKRNNSQRSNHSCSNHKRNNSQRNNHSCSNHRRNNDRRNNHECNNHSCSNREPNNRQRNNHMSAAPGSGRVRQQYLAALHQRSALLPSRTLAADRASGTTAREGVPVMKAQCAVNQASLRNDLLATLLLVADSSIKGAEVIEHFMILIATQRG